MEGINLTELQKDALKEIGNICSGNAATALSQLIGKRIDIVVPKILFVDIEEVPDAVGGAEQLVVGLILRVLGDLPGTIIFVFSQRDAAALSAMMVGKQPSDGVLIGDLERSALKEIGIILANAYLGAMGSFVGLSLVPTVPELIVDMAGAMIDFLLIELSGKCRFALLIESEFREPSASITGHFFLIPNADSLEAILKAIGKNDFT
jgi:chemotaxis protein CheC